jgi:hypothetical protein
MAEHSGSGRHGDFLKLWAGQTVSLFGSQITVLAIPLLAALTLGATPVQMSLLAGCGGSEHEERHPRTRRGTIPALVLPGGVPMAAPGE